MRKTISCCSARTKRLLINSFEESLEMYLGIEKTHGEHATALHFMKSSYIKWNADGGNCIVAFSENTHATHALYMEGHCCPETATHKFSGSLQPAWRIPVRWLCQGLSVRREQFRQMIVDHRLFSLVRDVVSVWLVAFFCQELDEGDRREAHGHAPFLRHHGVFACRFLNISGSRRFMASVKRIWRQAPFPDGTASSGWSAGRRRFPAGDLFRQSVHPGGWGTVARRRNA